jgi:hypothetical protein
LIASPESEMATARASRAVFGVSPKHRTHHSFSRIQEQELR